MILKFMPMGDYQTNCYILTTSAGDFIIDPGMSATNWVMKNVKNPVAILNTHGHFDHIWSNAELAKELKIPIYCPKDDVFMLKSDPFGLSIVPSEADFEVEEDGEFVFGEVKVKFHFFPGHTPGCSAIEITQDNQSKLFSGDFIFNGSIGRTDFPYSNSQHMIQSLEKILQWDMDIEMFPGHGPSTKLSSERNNLKLWINYLTFAR